MVELEKMRMGRSAGQREGCEYSWFLFRSRIRGEQRGIVSCKVCSEVGKVWCRVSDMVCVERQHVVHNAKVKRGERVT